MVNKEENYNTVLEMLFVNNVLIFSFFLYFRILNRYLNGVFLLLGRLVGVGLWELFVSYKYMMNVGFFLKLMN